MKARLLDVEAVVGLGQRTNIVEDAAYLLLGVRRPKRNSPKTGIADSAIG
ncbi:MAG: hypothetical protein IPJ76_00200 [Flavobacteriales bacterium]|nr:MAG: hypothetical protein IPJ76_00200 [Flavobacteriales bacterium]